MIVETAKQTKREEKKRRISKAPLTDRLRRAAAVLAGVSVAVPACQLEEAKPGKDPGLFQNPDSQGRETPARPDVAEVMDIVGEYAEAGDVRHEIDVPRETIKSDVSDTRDADTVFEAEQDQTGYDCETSDALRDQENDDSVVLNDADWKTEDYAEPDGHAGDDLFLDVDSGPDFSWDASFPDLEPLDETAYDDSAYDAETSDASGNADVLPDLVWDLQADDGIIIVPDIAEVDAEPELCQNVSVGENNGLITRDSPMDVAGYRFHYQGLAEGIDGVVLDIHCADGDAQIMDDVAFENIAGGDSVINELEGKEFVVEIHGSSNDYSALLTIHVYNL
ncbi:hypothetical protein GF318_00185 [Candidatus Micrarchaeota archaeon]|nr:hypothetical protein [Candidatus Micrarchaeota archaeon]